KGKTRLLQILILELAHLIWVLRCKRAIQESTHSDDEIKARWLRKINERLTCDQIIATIIKRDKPHTTLATSTWRHALQKQRDLPTDWISNREVLVGSGW
ncbi:hypothetical protein F5888DRAFT_1602583, partial [Russula emetica]